MTTATVSRIWVVSADRVVERAEVILSDDDAAHIRMRVRTAARELELLINSIADGRRAARREAATGLVRRFGDLAADVDQVAAAGIAEAVMSACADVSIPAPNARRLADSCRAAVLEATCRVNAVAGELGPHVAGGRGVPRPAR